MSAELEIRPIDLAEEPAFRLGVLEVRPATLEVIRDEGREQLEPRVMQVLVRLARDRGEVISRDELIASCWGGRIVGDDAINRCISRLRRLGQSSGAFEIDNVPRVGFRLREAATSERPGPDRRRPWIGLPIAILAAAVVTAGWFWLRPPSTPDHRIAISAFEAREAEPASSAFAARLTDTVAGVLSENLPGVAVTGPAERRKPPMISVEGAVSHGDGGWRVRTFLKDVKSGVTLWSLEFTAADEDRLRDQVAVATTQAIYNALEPLEQKGLQLDPRSIALYTKASEGNQNRFEGNRSETLRLFEQLVAREPDFVGARATLAIALLNAGNEGPPGEREAFHRRARQEADRAIRMDPSVAGAAYDVLSLLARDDPGDLAKSEGIILEGIRQSDFAYLNMRECRLLMEVGRNNAAVTYCQRALAIRPLAPQIGHVYARALYSTGNLQSAQIAIRKFVRYHPQHLPTAMAVLEMELFSGSPQEALAILADDARRPKELGAGGTEALRLFLKARITAAPGDIDAAVVALRTTGEGGLLGLRYLIYGAAVLGRLDDAFAALDALRPGDTFFMFSPPGDALRRDPRFWRVAARHGYVRYWQARDRWPDFCADPTLPYDCRQEAARVAG